MIHNYSTYANRKCKCDECLDAWRAYRKSWGERRLTLLQRNPNSQYHGRVTSYNVGCRCNRCSEARSKYAKGLYDARKNNKERSVPLQNRRSN